MTPKLVIMAKVTTVPLPLVLAVDNHTSTILTVLHLSFNQGYGQYYINCTNHIMINKS